MLETGPQLTDWIQASAAVASVGVAIWGTVLAYSARKTSREAQTAGSAARDAGEAAVRVAADLGNEAVNEQLRREGKTVWQIQESNGDSYTFTNTGTQTVRLIGVAGGDVMLMPGYEGVHISPGNYFKVLISRSLASPPVTRVEVEWEEGPRTVKQVYAVA